MHKWIVGSFLLTDGGEWGIYFNDTGKFVYPIQYKPPGLDIVFPPGNLSFGADAECSRITFLHLISIQMHLKECTCSTTTVQTNQI